MQCTINNNW